MPAEKAPGPDGFTGDFYRTCWSIIKSDVLVAFQCIFNLRTGPLPTLNTASIILLPKKDLAVMVKDYRPISLIHSFAKLVMEVLALRLTPAMDSLISNYLSTFIEKDAYRTIFCMSEI